MTSSECVKTIGGDVFAIEDVGGILLCFLYDSGSFDIKLLDAAFVP